MRTLVSYLNERTPQDLRIIAEKWDANQTDRLISGNTFQLAQEITNEFLQRRIVEKLSAQEVAVLQFIIKQEDYTAAVEDIAAALSWPKEQATTVTNALVQLGLLFNEEQVIKDAEPITRPITTRKSGWGKFLLATETTLPTKNVLTMPRELARPFARLLSEKFPDEPPAVNLSHLPLKQLLQHLEPEILESQAQNWGLLSLVGNAKPEEIADELAKALSNATVQKRVLSELPADAQKLFKRLKKDKRTTIKALLEEFVSYKRLGRGLRPLIEALLVWEVFENNKLVVFVPEEIRNPQETDFSKPTISLQIVAEPTEAIFNAPNYALAWDILTFVNYIGQNEVELTKDEYIPKRHLKKLSTLFWVEEDDGINSIRVSLIAELAYRFNLVTNDANLRIQPGTELNAWLAKDFYTQMRELFAKWLENPYFSGFFYFPYYYNTQQMKTQVCNKILGWLQDCEVGAWYSFDSLLTKVLREDPYFIRSRQDLLKQFRPSDLDQMARHWKSSEGQIINYVFTFLSWLGLVKVTHEDELGKVLTFSLTDFGAEIVQKPGASPVTIPVAPTPILVQPNFEIMLLSPQVDILWALLKFANQKKLDLVSIYTLDRTSVLRGMETGFTTTAIVEWLAKRNPQPLPQNVEVSVQDWGKGFKRVTVEQCVLLEVESPQVLDELLQSKKYAEYFVRRLSPTAAVVKLPSSASARTDPLKSFRTLLKNGGFFAR